MFSLDAIWAVIKRHTRAITIWAISAIILSVIGWGVSDFLSTQKKEAEIASRQQKYVAVIMSTTDESFTLPTEFMTGFGSKQQVTDPSSRIRTQDNEMVQIRYSDDNYSVAGARRLAQKLVADKNCVMIIGNSNSELTGVTLNEILESKDPPALIMPIATVNNLTSIATDASYRAILRMVPNNKDQALQIKSFIASRAPRQRIVMLVDEQNTDYSNDLSSDIGAKVRENGGVIVLQKSYGNNSRLVDYVGFIKHAKADFLIFVGVSDNGLLLIDDLAANNLSLPVIFTDGGTVNALIKRSAELPVDTYFLSAVGNSSDTTEPTYKPIGADAYTLLVNIISGAKSNTRESIRAHIEYDKNSIVVTGGQAGDYKFNEEGENVALHFKIYRNNHGSLQLMTGY